MIQFVCWCHNFISFFFFFFLFFFLFFFFFFFFFFFPSRRITKISVKIPRKCHNHEAQPSRLTKRRDEEQIVTKKTHTKKNQTKKQTKKTPYLKSAAHKKTCNTCRCNHFKCRPRWLSWMRRPTGDQEVADLTPPRSATFFRRDWSWNIFYGHSLPSADSRRAVVSFWRKNKHDAG